MKKLLILTLLLSQVSLAETITIPEHTDMVGKALSEQECLTVNAYHEARSESDLSNLMIMSVVANRSRDKRHKGASYCEVVFHPKAFSWTGDGKSDKILEKGQYVRLYKLAEKFMRNTSVYLDLSEGADHYHTVGLKTKWNYEVLRYIGRFDNHVFYKWKRRK